MPTPQYATQQILRPKIMMQELQSGDKFSVQIPGGFYRKNW